MTFIQCYAPTTNAEEIDNEEFYGLLQQTVDEVLKEDTLLVIGDMNAKVGACETSRSTRRFELGSRNDAGSQLIEFCEANDLMIMNTCIEQLDRRMYTWTTPDGKHKNQIDYVMCSNHWKSTMQSANSLPGAD